MAVIFYNYEGSDDGCFRTVQGLNVVKGGDIYQQYGATTAIANSTVETSVLNPATTAQYQGIASTPGTAVSTIPLIPYNSLTTGLILKAKAVGTIANTGTPTLRCRAVLKNAAGTVVYTLADTTATAMTTTAATDFEINFDGIVKSVGASGSVGSRITHRYATTNVYATYGAVTVDTTAQYYFDILLTWGAASASNTCTIQWATVGVQ